MKKIILFTLLFLTITTLVYPAWKIVSDDVRNEGLDYYESGGSVEGTAILSTGEAGGTKFLREDGDGTCSWQTPAGGTYDNLTVNSTAIDTTGNIKDSTDITWAITDGGAGGPDDIAGTVADKFILNTGDTGSGTYNLTAVNVGVDDTTKGVVRIYGHATGDNTGGTLYIHTSADNDAVQDSYIIQAYENDLYMGRSSDFNPSTSTYLLKFTDADNIAQGAGTFYQYGGEIYLGSGDTLYGLLQCQGNGTGSSQGGKIMLHTDADDDTVINAFGISAIDDTFVIGTIAPGLDYTITPKITLDAAGDLTVGNVSATTVSSTIKLGSLGVQLSGDNDGGMDWLGMGNGYDERLTWNLDDVENTVGVSSDTGVTKLDLGSIDLATDTLELTGTGTINGLDAIDATTETTLEGALDIDGEVSSTGMGSTVLDETGISLTSITIGSLLGVDSIDATGAVDMDYGSADITDHTFVTDGGTVILDGNINSSTLTASEIVITDASKNLISAAVATYPSLTELSYVKGLSSAVQTQIGGKQATVTEGSLANSVILSEDIKDGEVAGADINAVLDLGGKTSFEIPNAAAPTTDATGEIAVDTNIITQGMAQIYLASAIGYIVATTDTPGDNEIPTYDSAGGTIQWEAGGAGGGPTYREYTFLPESCVLDDTVPPAITVIESSGTGTPRFRVADFDAAADEQIFYTFVMPSDATASADPIIEYYWYANDVGPNEGVAWGCQVSSTTEADADTMAEQAADADILIATEDVNETEANRLIKTSGTLTYATYMDGAVAGDVVTIRIFRDISDAADDLTSDARLVSIHLKIPRS